jgi:hypothetical protein
MRTLFEHRIPRFQERSRNCRSLGFAPPDFLRNLMALTNLMRLSFKERRTRNPVQSNVAGNPDRDDKKEGATVHKEWLLYRGVLSNLIWTTGLGSRHRSSHAVSSALIVRRTAIT